MINFYGNEIDSQECSKVIAVENDCLQLIDVKKKEIKRLKIKKDTNENRDWLISLSLNNRGGRGFCTIIRDYQLRPFDYLLEEEDHIITGMDTQTQMKILQIKIEEATAQMKTIEKEQE